MYWQLSQDTNTIIACAQNHPSKARAYIVIQADHIAFYNGLQCTLLFCCNNAKQDLEEITDILCQVRQKSRNCNICKLSIHIDVLYCMVRFKPSLASK
mmetsp:Transcript_25920/g.54098  ORF Transcript_25920/g.54098 Transcript_25920/m.54098 type:complete len:98 (+) Transcript_25920:1060-1353(+)